MLGVGIIGGGRVAPGHARAVQTLADQLELKAVAEPVEELLAQRKQEWGCDGYADYRRMLERGDLHLCVICLPHHLHAPVATDVVSAGKHVFIEKPLAMTVEECDRIIETAQRRGVKVGVGHHHHWTPVNVRAKQMLDSGKLGRLVFATDTWYKRFYDSGTGTRPPWFLERESGGGMFWMNGPHLVDRLMFFIGSPVVAVKACVGSPFFGFSAPDAAMALLQFANGVYATLISTGHKTGVTWSHGEITCAEGMLKFEHGRLWVNNHEEKYVEVELPKWDTFARQHAGFVEAIENDTPPPVPGEYGREVVRVMLACEESSRTGKEVRLV